MCSTCLVNEGMNETKGIAMVVEGLGFAILYKKVVIALEKLEILR